MTGGERMLSPLLPSRVRASAAGRLDRPVGFGIVHHVTLEGVLAANGVDILPGGAERIADARILDALLVEFHASAFLRCVQFAFGLAPVLQLLAVRTPLLFPQLIGALSNDVLRNRHDVSFPGEM